MKAKAGVLDTLEPGDMFSMPERETVPFAGENWHVLSYVGDRDRGLLIIDRRSPDHHGVAESVESLLLAAANMLVVGADWSKTSPADLCEIGAQGFRLHFRKVLTQHLETLSKRGKPS